MFQLKWIVDNSTVNNNSSFYLTSFFSSFFIYNTEGIISTALDKYSNVQKKVPPRHSTKAQSCDLNRRRPNHVTLTEEGPIMWPNRRRLLLDIPRRLNHVTLSEEGPIMWLTKGGPIMWLLPDIPRIRN